MPVRREETRRDETLVPVVCPPRLMSCPGCRCILPLVIDMDLTQGMAIADSPVRHTHTHTLSLSP
jgi:hypothetical protein